MRNWALIFLLLAGCDSPSLYFAQAPALYAEAGGFRFSIRVMGNAVEAIRVSRHRPPRLAEVQAAARRAIEDATGCAVTALSGDQAIVKATIRCG